jgi:predicted GIY-YIG superfamily endonuclease
MKAPDFRLPARAITKHIVYAWGRGDRYLYVGMSKNGLGRLNNHHVIGVKEEVGPDDFIDIFACNSMTQACQLEQRYIEKFSPRWNISLQNEGIRRIRRQKRLAIKYILDRAKGDL